MLATRATSGAQGFALGASARGPARAFARVRGSPPPAPDAQPPPLFPPAASQPKLTPGSKQRPRNRNPARAQGDNDGRPASEIERLVDVSDTAVCSEHPPAPTQVVPERGMPVTSIGRTPGRARSKRLYPLGAGVQAALSSEKAAVLLAAVIGTVLTKVQNAGGDRRSREPRTGR
jgi:hypothetical protein